MWTPRASGRAARWAACATLGAALVVAAGDVAAAQVPLAGVIRAHQDTTLHSETGGIVDRIEVREGDVVTEGQPLVQLKNDREKIAVDLARAELTKAQAEVTETTVMLDSARKALERVTRAGGALPRKELEDNQDVVDRLTATLTANNAERSRAEQELRLHEQELKETQLDAPFAGTITEINVHRGDTLRAMDTPVLDLVDLHSLYVELIVPGGAARRLRIGQSIPVTVESEWLGRAGNLIGTVSYVDPTVDAASRTVKVKVNIADSNGAVRPGMLAKVRFDDSPVP